VSGNDFVFRRERDGSLEFVGAFEDLYKAIEDPWAQSVPDERMGAYYEQSRNRILSLLRGFGGVEHLVELGCGLGQVCAMIYEAGVASRVTGLDVSITAIEKARKRHPNLEFDVADARKDWPASIGRGFDAILMNQMLWYILEDLDGVFSRTVSLLRPNGRLIVSQAFIQDNQQYGADIIDGFQGLVRYVASIDPKIAKVVYAGLLEDPDLPFDDGIVVLRRYDQT
jgi:SAM-dependent methyltransferase